MREIIFDTETTGFSPHNENPDRIVEIGAVEVIGGELTDRTFHQYINPKRGIPTHATMIHGVDNDKVKHCPTFADIVDDFLDFVGTDSKLVAHNASFDMRFINAELLWCGKSEIPNNRVIDTWHIAKQHFSAPNTLDALCERFKIDNAHRDFHGALLDAKLLYGVYTHLKNL